MGTCIRSVVGAILSQGCFLITMLQCADLTLSSNTTIPSNATCKNETAQDPHGSEAPNPSQTAGALGRAQNVAGYTALLMGFSGVALMHL